MSNKLLNAAWKVDARAPVKLALVRLADAAGPDGRCWLSVTTLAIDCATTRRVMFRYLDELEGAGHIRREARSGRSSVIHVNPRPVTVETPLPVSPQTPLAQALGDETRARGDTPPVSEESPTRAPTVTPPVSPETPRTMKPLHEPGERTRASAARVGPIKLPRRWYDSETGLLKACELLDIPTYGKSIQQLKARVNEAMEAGLAR